MQPYTEIARKLGLELEVITSKNHPPSRYGFVFLD